MRAGAHNCEVIHRMRPRVSFVVCICVLLTTIGVSVKPQVALATCSVGQAIFTYPSNGGVQARGTGGIGRVFRSRNTVDSSCSSSNWQDVNTVNFLFDDSAAYYYEIGSQELNSAGTTTGTHRLRIFIELHLNSSTLDYVVYGNSGQPAAPCSGDYLETDGGVLDFVITTNGSGSWTGWVDCHDGAWLRNIHTVSAYATTGISRGEWERQSTAVSTNMTQSMLQFRDPNNPNGSWINWNPVSCWGNALPGYKYSPSSNSWSIIGGYGC